ncbi:MAG: NAD-dependent epimerase/dehydratase family protein [Cyclobacteriaceae bacterium]|nr:NAD-dependent epimerase/dehydratase family protein [Cyclobacteriaceae bacterium]
MELKIILTGATGMVGEGVLLECLQHPDISQILLVNRRASGVKHQKVKELLIPDFLNLEGNDEILKGYDACFFCAGISSAGMNEAEYTRITYDTTIHFAKKLVTVNPEMIFSFVSGSHTDSSEKGSIMWARVKGRTENALAKLPFRKVYNFRPGFMRPTVGQKNVKGFYKVIGSMYTFFKFLFPSNVSTMRQVGQAMINSVTKGYTRQILEVRDINTLAAS